ncbi:MAG: hypothetical protein ACREJ3_10985, partial [Polyangiaceae bacterium]
MRFRSKLIRLLRLHRVNVLGWGASFLDRQAALKVLPCSGSVSPKLLALLGISAALSWAFLALAERSAWTPVGLAVLAASLVVMVASRRAALALGRALMAPRRWVLVSLCALCASGISWVAVREILHTTPLAIDAGVYLMQARAMSHLHFGMPAPIPREAFSDRFLFEGPDGRLYG